MVAEHVVGQAGRVGGQRHDGLELVVGQRRGDGGAGQPGGVPPRGQVAGVGQVAARRLGLLEDLLAEPGQHQVRVPLVEVDQLGQRAGQRPGRAELRDVGQVRVDAVLELVAQRGELGLGDLAPRRAATPGRSRPRRARAAGPPPRRAPRWWPARPRPSRPARCPGGHPPGRRRRGRASKRRGKDEPRPVRPVRSRPPRPGPRGRRRPAPRAGPPRPPRRSPSVPRCPAPVRWARCRGG